MEYKTLEELKQIAAEQGKLLRDVKREELIIVEEAARTVEDFDELFEKYWDTRDDNRERKERRNEYLMNDEMFDWNLWDDDNFIDLIYCNPTDMHQLVSDVDLSRLIKKSTQKQKAVFFPYAVRRCGTTKISVCHCMTDRNVRKLCDLMKDNIQREMSVILQKRIKTGEPLTIEQRQFLSTYKPKLKGKIKKVWTCEN